MFLQHVFSTIHHSHYTDTSSYTYGKMVRFVDRNVARATWLYIIFRNSQLALTPGAIATYACILYVPVVYFYKIVHYPGSAYRPHGITLPMLLHATMHLAAGIGSHICFEAHAAAKLNQLEAVDVPMPFCQSPGAPFLPSADVVVTW